MNSSSRRSTKSRGNRPSQYKRYLWDPTCPIPPSTLKSWKRKGIFDEIVCSSTATSHDSQHGHVTTQQDHMTTKQDHRTTKQDHRTTKQDHLTTKQDHMTTKQCQMNITTISKKSQQGSSCLASQHSKEAVITLENSSSSDVPPWPKKQRCSSDQVEEHGVAEDCISVIDLDSVEDGDDGSRCDGDDGSSCDGDDGSRCDGDDGISIMFEDCDSVSNDDIGCDGYGSDGVGDAECDGGGHDGVGGHDGAGEDGEEDNFTDVNDSVRTNVPATSAALSSSANGLHRANSPQLHFEQMTQKELLITLCQLVQKLVNRKRCCASTTENDEFTINGYNILSITADNPRKFALKALDIAFSLEELGHSTYKFMLRPKNPSRPTLDPQRVEMIERAIVQKFGAEEFRKYEKEIYTACNQKCSHIHNAKFKT